MTDFIRLSTGSDGRSHVERSELPLGTKTRVGIAHIEQSQAHSALAWHTAPCRHSMW